MKKTVVEKLLKNDLVVQILVSILSEIIHDKVEIKTDNKDIIEAHKSIIEIGVRTNPIKALCSIRNLFYKRDFMLTFLLRYLNQTQWHDAIIMLGYLEEIIIDKDWDDTCKLNLETSDGYVDVIVNDYFANINLVTG